MNEILKELAAHGMEPKKSTVKGVAQKLGASLVSTWGRVAVVDYFVNNKAYYNDQN